MSGRGKLPVTASIAIGVLALLAIVAVTTLISIGIDQPVPQDPNATNIYAKLLEPGSKHWLGTDQLGRDVFSRVLHGTYVSLGIGLVAVMVSITIGVVVGSISGYMGGKIDAVIMRMVDAIICFPSFFLILTVVALLGPSIWNVIMVIGLVSWTTTARLVRAEFLSLRESQYVAAAKAMGQSHFHVIWKHILPNASGPILVSAILGVPEAILTEAGLSFLGVGVQPPQATWGNIIADGKLYILDAWWLILFPGLAILITALAFYLAGDGVKQKLLSRGERSTL